MKDTAIDYMHAVLEGVTKAMIKKFWLNGKYKSHRFYLSKEVKQIDEKLLDIRPPHEFRRTPRSIEKTINYWKASELRAWLLFYSIPILFDFLHRDYLYHLNLLIKSMHILLSVRISSNDLKSAEKMLTLYYKKSLDLYPQEVCSMNLHSSIHLPQTVKNLGPLWAYSCFGFESMNGHLKKHCHGTRNVLPQLVRNLRFHQEILDQEHKVSNHEDGIRGRVKHKELCTQFLEALHAANLCSTKSTFPVFPRFKLNGILYGTWKGSKRLRNSSVCKFMKETGVPGFGSIHCFCYCDQIPVAIIADIGSVKNAFQDIPRSTIQELNFNASKYSCIFKCEKLTNSTTYIAIPVSLILTKCVHIPVKSKSFDFIVPIPNSYEHH